MTKPPSARIYAAIYSCSERSIRNYRAEDAPLHDPAAMFAWWASRRNMPRSTAAKGLEAVQAAYASVVGKAAPLAGGDTAAVLDQPPAMSVPGDLPAGAEHELRWLASLAVEARHNLIRAKQSNNPVTIKQALDSYLKITEGLRKYDNQVAADRRDAGEVISRTAVEPIITTFTVWFRRGVEGFINEACLKIAEADRPEDVYAMIAPSLRGNLTNAVNAAFNDGKFPLWLKQAFEEGL